jgi:hypothetical protein
MAGKFCLKFAVLLAVAGLWACSGSESQPYHETNEDVPIQWDVESGDDVDQAELPPEVTQPEAEVGPEAQPEEVDLPEEAVEPQPEAAEALEEEGVALEAEEPPEAGDEAEVGEVSPLYPMPAAAGAVLITEFMPKAQAGADGGEWFEVFNPGNDPLDLMGCLLKDDGTDLHAIAAPVPVLPGAYVVLAKSGDPAANHGLEQDYVYSNYILANSGDEIVLQCGEVVIDRLVYGGGQVEVGRALQLDPTAFDADGNDDMGNWCLAEAPYGDGTLFGTPGAGNVECVHPLLVDWCRLQWPLDSSVEVGAALTVYGRVFVGGVTDLTDWVDTDARVWAQAGYGPDGSLPEGNGAWVWLDADGNPDWNADTAAEPGNDEYQASLTAPAAGVYDLAYRFSADSGATWVYCDRAAGLGHDGSEDGYAVIDAGSLTVSDVPVDPCDPNPCVTAPAADCSADGTALLTYQAPGACTVNDGQATCDYPVESETCAEGKVCLEGTCVVKPLNGPAAPGAVVITEFMAKSMGGTDAGEWVELHNPGAEALDLKGCILKDDGANNHSISASLTVEAGGYLVLGPSGDVAKTHGLAVDYVYANFGLSNSGDEIVLLCGGVEIDRVEYGPALVVQGYAAQLNLEAYDAQANDLADSWCLGSTPYGDGTVFGTPGDANLVCPKPPVVGWCRLQHPLELSLVTNQASPAIYGRVFVDGVTSLTDGVDVDARVEAQVGYGPDGSDPAGNAEWRWADAVPTLDWSASAAGEAGNDEYQAEFAVAAAGAYDFAYRFSADGGATWVYCDKAAGPGHDGSEDGYQVDNAGALSVSLPDPCQPNPCSTAPATACDIDGHTQLTYSAPGNCTAGPQNEAVCDYPPTPFDCAADNGKVCMDGECVVPIKVPTQPGDLVVSELMPESQAGGSDKGEWVELYNPGAEPLGINGCVLKDAVSNSHVINASLLVPAAGFAVLAASGDAALNHGLTADYVYGNFVLNNSGDSVILQCGGVEIDALAYQAAQVSLGHAAQLDPESMTAVANDDLANWCLATTSYGDGTVYGTPGAANLACPKPLKVDWCRLQHPLDAAQVAGEAVTTTYGRLYVNQVTNLTDGVDLDPRVRGQAGFGPDGSDPAASAEWTWVDASANPGWSAQAAGEPNNDEYQADVAASVAGTFDLAFRFSVDNGATWTYCDKAAGFQHDGSEDGYQVENSGNLVVTLPDPCAPNPCTVAPAPSCDADGVTLRTWSAPGACSAGPANEAVCDFPVEPTDCAAVGKVCRDGACVDLCVPNPCTTPPAPECDPDGKTLKTWAAAGTCTMVGQGTTCDYALTTFDCSTDNGKVCLGGACNPSVAAPAKKGDLIITEFMAMSQSGAPDPGEWVELYNPGVVPMELTGCILKDLASNTHTIAGSLLVLGGDYVVLGASTDPAKNHGAPVDYQYANFQLSNSGDEIILTCAGTEIDRVAYTSSWVFEAHSYQLALGKYDASLNDTKANWCQTSSAHPISTGFFGTPGAVNLACPN